MGKAANAIDRRHRADGMASRQALLDAAVSVAAERGVAGLTHRAVTERAGMPGTAVAYYFGSIENLAREAVAEFARRHIDRVDALSAALRDGELDERGFLEAIVALSASTEQRLLVAQYELYLHASRSPQTRQLSDAVLAAYERMAEAALRSAGVPRPGAFVRWFTCVIDGYLLQSLGRADGLDADGLRSAIQALFAACRRRSA